MTQLPQVANSDTNAEGMGDRSPLAAGDYIFCITKSEFKATKAKTGHYLNLTLAVQEGERKGSLMWVLMNLDNPNPIAVEIANKELNSICQACGLAAVEDSDELHGIPFGATVTVKPGGVNYAPSNGISTYMPADDISVAPPVEEGTDVAPKQEAGETSKPKMPWEKK